MNKHTDNCILITVSPVHKIVHRIYTSDTGEREIPLLQVIAVKTTSLKLDHRTYATCIYLIYVRFFDLKTKGSLLKFYSFYYVSVRITESCRTKHWLNSSGTFFFFNMYIKEQHYDMKLN